MGHRSDGAARTEAPAAPAERSILASKRRALELVAVRGKDVVGVRHLLDGARATIGAGADAIVRIPDSDRPFTVALVRGEQFVVRVPAGARARVHFAADGLARIVAGPADVHLADGDRAVVYVGQHQVRARISEIETLARGAVVTAKALRWLAAVGAVYVTALALCALLVPSHPAALATSSLGRAVHATLVAAR